MRDDKIAETSALLDYYSGRAVAHASFFVASIFGILTFAGIVANFKELPTLPIIVGSIHLQLHLQLIIGTILFIAFAYMGYNSLITFNHYASLSNDIAAYPIKEKQLSDDWGWVIPLGKHRESQEKWISTQEFKSGKYSEYKFVTYGENRKKRERLVGKLSLYKLISSRMRNRHMQPVLGFIYWAIIILLGVFSFYNHIFNFAWLWILTVILDFNRNRCNNYLGGFANVIVPFWH